MSAFLSWVLAGTLGAAPVLSLEQAMDEAQKQSLDLQIVKARAQQAEQLSARAWAAYLPTLSVGASYTRNNVEAAFSQPTRYSIRDTGPGADPFPTLPGAPTTLSLVPAEFVEVVIQPRNALGAQAQLSQAILAPALFPAIRAASFAEDAALANTENVRREVLFQVAQAFYGMAALQETLKVTERLLEVAKAHEKDAQLKERAGAVAKLVRLRAELDRSRAEQDVLRANNSLASARLALATLLNRPADFEVASPPEPKLSQEFAEGSPELVSQALKERPDVRAARFSANAASSSRTASILRYLPSLGFNARYSISNAAGFAGDNKIWALSLAANWTLFDGGLREADLRDAAAKLVEARALQSQAERRTSDEMARARLDWLSAQASRQKAEESAQLARESFAVAELNFRAGAGTYLEVTDANAALSNAEVSLLTERLNVQLAALRLSKASGQFAAP